MSGWGGLEPANMSFNRKGEAIDLLSWAKLAVPGDASHRRSAGRNTTMKTAIIAAALSLPLLAACGSAAATHPAAPQAAPAATATSAQCSRLHAAVKTIRADTDLMMPGNPRMLAIVASNGNAAKWLRLLKHAAAAPGPARPDIALAEADVAFLRVEASITESGTGNDGLVVKPWNEMTGALRDAAAACKHTERG